MFDAGSYSGVLLIEDSRVHVITQNSFSPYGLLVRRDVSLYGLLVLRDVSEFWAEIRLLVESNPRHPALLELREPLG